MKITHLVVNGCSWTYCQGLENPKNQGWPTLLAKKIGCEVVNLAYPGSGNDGIRRRTYEYVYENLPTDSKPLFVICFSQYWRREAWFEICNGSPIHDYNIVAQPKEKIENPYQEALLENYNEEEFIRNTMYNKLALQSLFHNLNIPYIMTDYWKENFSSEVLNSVKNRFTNMFKNFENINDIDTLRFISNKYKPTPCGHDGPEAMIEIADILYDTIIKKYNDLEIINGNFLSLKNFPLRGPKAPFTSDWQ